MQYQFTIELVYDVRDICYRIYGGIAWFCCHSGPRSGIFFLNWKQGQVRHDNTNAIKVRKI